MILNIQDYVSHSMKRLPSYSLLVGLLIISLLFIITCKKEYSYEGGLKAVYSFVGALDTCTDVVIQGNYIAGIPADSSNHAAVYIIVTTAGSAEFTTETVNGIFFTTGQITLTKSSPLRYGIVLICHGTPTAAGTFTFHIPGTGGCSFSVTVMNLADADYTFSGAPGDCGNPVDQGTYQKGVAMIAANVVTINVNVLSAGPYTISTDKVNGFSFSASGMFTSPGTQQVILQATGKPEVPELSQFRLQGAATECTFYIGVANAEPVATYVLQSAQENGQLYCAPGSVQGNYTAGTSLTVGNTITVNAYVRMVGNYTISTTELNGIKFTYTGTFTATGAQDVILKGSGTPTTSGLFTFYPQIVGPAPLGGAGCGLDITVQ